TRPRQGRGRQCRRPRGEREGAARRSRQDPAAEERDRATSRRARRRGEDDQRVADDEDVRGGRGIREGDRSLARRVVKRGLIFLLIAIPALVIAQPSGAPPAADSPGSAAAPTPPPAPTP